MRYLGGKHRLAKKISRYLKKIRKPGQTYLEPFVGAANVLCLMDNPRIGSDIHLDVILLLRAARDNKLSNFPKEMTKKQYNILKRSKPSPLRGLVGHGCSFAGVWFSTYAHDIRSRKSFYGIALDSIKRKGIKLQGSTLNCKNYLNLNPINCLIYCDPPYNNTYSPGNKRYFNNTKFWQVMREWSKNNTVIISEYKAPDDFKCVLSIKYNLQINTTSDNKRIEKLFRFKG